MNRPLSNVGAIALTGIGQGVNRSLSNVGAIALAGIRSGRGSPSQQRARAALASGRPCVLWHNIMWRSPLDLTAGTAERLALAAGLLALLWAGVAWALGA